MKKIYEESGYELKKFFNTSGVKYRELGLKEVLKTAMFEVPDLDNVNRVLVDVNDEDKIVCNYETAIKEDTEM